QTEQLKLIEIEPVEGHGTPGTVIETNKTGMTIATGDGALLIRRIQRPNRKPVTGIEYARALNVEQGHQL
ncbi:MAG: methionyl-tRNA formyltransferase, partial [Bradymonadia bacterium]